MSSAPVGWVCCAGFDRSSRHRRYAVDDSKLSRRSAAVSHPRSSRSSVELRSRSCGVDGQALGGVQSAATSGHRPSRSRDDYYWSNRDVIWRRPKGVGIGWRTNGQVLRGKEIIVLVGRFVEDATSCAINGQRRDALVRLVRAAWISPPTPSVTPRALDTVFVVVFRRAALHRPLAVPIGEPGRSGRYHQAGG